MTNPWFALPPEPDYVLPIDSDQIHRHNAQRPENEKLVLSSIPEPFIGNPETAKVVLLLLNPGHADGDTKAHQDPALKTALFRNLRGEPQEYPFYPLHPDFERHPTAQWWVPRTRELLRIARLTPKQLSERLLALEWFPYHSQTAGLPVRQVCRSQEYTFAVAKRMIETRLVLRMRSVSHWEAVDPRLRHAPYLKNPRSCYLTRRNMESESFDRLVEALNF